MYAEKLLPHDLEAEEAVVGSVLIDGDCFARVAPYIKADDFYRERNQLCFAACEALFQRDEAIDQVTLARELSRASQLETVGGMAYLSHLISVTPTSVHSEHYANVVARTATMRKLIDVASRISAMGYQDTDDVDATLRQAEDALFTIRGPDSQRGFIPLRQIYDQYLEDQAAIADPVSENSGPIMVGYTDLDELLGGVQRSDLIILGARPSLGKSTLALNICLNAAKNGSSAGVFSLEMSREQLALRILSSEAEIDSHRLRLGLLTEAEGERITDAIGQLSDLPVYIDDTPFQSLTEMRSKARRLSLEHGLDLLVVDYLQLIQGRGGRSDNRVQEISEITRSLKSIARELEIPVIAGAQLSRAIDSRPEQRPRLSDLRESGSIEQDADVVLFLYPESNGIQHSGPLKMKAEISKHRNGAVGEVELVFLRNQGVFLQDRGVSSAVQPPM